MMRCGTQAALARRAAARAHDVPDTPQFIVFVARQPVARHHGAILICTCALHSRAACRTTCILPPPPPTLTHTQEVHKPRLKSSGQNSISGTVWPGPAFIWTPWCCCM